jgi:hypothetical protein
MEVLDEMIVIVFEFELEFKFCLSCLVCLLAIVVLCSGETVLNCELFEVVNSIVFGRTAIQGQSRLHFCWSFGDRLSTAEEICARFESVQRD